MRDIEVVIPTLGRDCFLYCMRAVNRVFGDVIIHLRCERGVPLGLTRNNGLYQCSSRFVAFIDDDVIVNGYWLNRCLSELEADPMLVGVQGRVPEGETLGCMVVRREAFLAGGGFPPLDSYVNERFKGRMRVLDDVVCYHYACCLS